MLSRRCCDGQTQVPSFFEFCFERFGCEILLVSMYCSLRRRLFTKITTVVNPLVLENCKDSMKFQHGQNRYRLFTLLDAPGINLSEA